MFAAVRAGARGYLLKGARRQEIVRAIQSGRRGRGDLRAGHRRPGDDATSASAPAQVGPTRRSRSSPTASGRSSSRSPQGLENAEIARALGPVGQDRAQPREQHLRQAAGGPPRAGDRAGPRGRPRVIRQSWVRAGTRARSRASSAASAPMRWAAVSSSSTTLAPLGSTSGVPGSTQPRETAGVDRRQRLRQPVERPGERSVSTAPSAVSAAASTKPGVLRTRLVGPERRGHQPLMVGRTAEVLVDEAEPVPDVGQRLVRRRRCSRPRGRRPRGSRSLRRRERHGSDLAEQRLERREVDDGEVVGRDAGQLADHRGDDSRAWSGRPR